MNMTEITNLNLDHDLVLRAIRTARVIALKNRCTYIGVHIACVTGDVDTIKSHVGASVHIDQHRVFGVRFIHGTSRSIFIRPGRNNYLTVKTLCHELAHAFTNPMVKHGYSWRSLYLLFWATIPRIFGIYEADGALYEEAFDTVNRYEIRGNTPYERHHKAMLRMRSWYVDQVENGKVV
jgi:hypothetical protein